MLPANLQPDLQGFCERTLQPTRLPTSATAVTRILLTNIHTMHSLDLEYFALKTLQLRRIVPDGVNLTPKLIRYNH